MVGNPKVGEATVSFNVSQANILLDWDASFWSRNSTEHNIAIVLADQNYKGKHRIDMTGCLISSVEFTNLDAKDGKKVVEITTAFKPVQVTYNPADGGNIQSPFGLKRKYWRVSNWKAIIPGIQPEHIMKIELPKLTSKNAEESYGASRPPRPHSVSVDISSMKIEVSSLGFQNAANLAAKTFQDGVISDVGITIDMYDETMKAVLGTFTCKGCGLKKFEVAKWGQVQDSDLSSTLEFTVDEFLFEVKTQN